MISLRPTDPQEGTLRDLAPDLTPMLDILFILLVFFMLTAGAAFQSLELTLPSSVSDNLPMLNNTPHIMVEVNAGGYALDGTPYATLEQLNAALPQTLSAKPEHSLVIAGDKHVEVEKLLNLLTMLQAQGIEAANILMQEEHP